MSGMEPTQTPPPVNPDPVPAAPVAPEAPTAPAAPAPAAAPGAQPSGPAARILLVEDDNNLANIYVTRLQAEGFDVRRVANGEEALAAALNYKPDLIILDVMMPKGGGFD